MHIFIGNIPETEYQDEILGLIKRFDKSAPNNTELQLHSYDKGYFCVVDIAKDKSARKFIKKCDGKRTSEHTLIVREFVHRVYGNERRDIRWRQTPWNGEEKRIEERRAKRSVLDTHIEALGLPE